VSAGPSTRPGAPAGPGAQSARPGDLAGRRLPPVAHLAVSSMVLVIAAGIYLASHLPRHAPLAPAAGLVAGAGALLLAGVVLVSRITPFNWPVFFQVAGWALLAYLVISGMLEYVFVLDHTRGSMLALLSLSLLVFAVDIPLVLAFSVARYQPVELP
jgi:hypothetical protein